jgi:long-chain fatty acid transport protein
MTQKNTRFLATHTKRNLARSACRSLGLALAVSALPAFGNGFDLADEDAFAIGRGMAFVATADNPSAIYYNPAGISQLSGNNLRAGVYGIYVDPGYQSLAGGNTFHTDKNYHVVPQFYYTLSPASTDFSFGLGLYSPFGLSSHWPQDTGFRTIATQGSISYYTINPVVAWRILTNLSVAAGLTINYADTELERGLVWPAQNYDNFKFDGNGWGVGYNLGVLWKPHEQISMGATFRSSVEPTLNGSTEYYNNVPFIFGPLMVPAFPTQTVPAHADLSLPLQAQVGISYRPTPKWNFEFDAQYNDWSALKGINVHQDQGFGALIPQDVTVPLGWQSSWYYEFGATYYFDNGWHLSAGYIFNENSMPDLNYTPLVADLDRHFFSIGTGFKGKTWDFDIAYQFGYGPSRTVTGSGYSAIGQTADGKYDSISHLLAVSVGFHF